mgnify:CR=1 FL=1
MTDYPALHLDHILIHNGLGSVRSVKTLLRNHIICVNGVRNTDGRVLVSPTKDIVELDGKALELHNDVYLMMNKPQNTVCTTLSDRHKTVFDLIDEKYRSIKGLGKLHSVGRLDAHTEGFVLLTTNGNFSHRLTSPETHVTKTYLVYLRDKVDEKQKIEYSEKAKAGIAMAAEKKAKEALAKPAALEWIAENEEYTACKLTISEGKFHQVKRMFLALGNEVVFLKRLGIGSLYLGENLQLGEYSELSADELALLL